MKLNTAAGTAGTSWDLLAITGTLSLNSITAEDPFMIVVTSLDGANVPGAADNFQDGQSYSWMIATASAGISGFTADKFAIDTSGFLNDPANLGGFAISQVGSSLMLNYTVVPEPAEWGVISAWACSPLP